MTQTTTKKSEFIKKKVPTSQYFGNFLVVAYTTDAILPDLGTAE